ncbi:MAG TPA: DNA methyltransferase [Candidatus Methanoperedens sp.]|nr:DNA methyltransferase [Candidatus Methanoperedens sp.]
MKSITQDIDHKSLYLIRPLHPRNLILRYTAPKDLVLDQMVGSGSTLVECKLPGRRAVGVDINPDAVMVARNRLDFSYATLDADYVCRR